MSQRNLLIQAKPLHLLRLAYEAMDLGWHMGDVVRKLREQRRWTQSKLAAFAKVNKATIVSVEEHAAGTKRETYEKVARAFNLTLGELFSLVPGETKGAQGTMTGATFPEWDQKTERRHRPDRRVAAHGLAANDE